MLAVRRPWDSNKKGHKPGHFLYDVQYSGSVPVSIKYYYVTYVVLVLLLNGVAGLCRDCGVHRVQCIPSATHQQITFTLFQRPISRLLTAYNSDNFGNDDQ
jgi:hypothetical protein